MKSSLHDLSSQTELALLGKVVCSIQQATQGLDAPMFLMGAAARDTMLHSVYGIRSTRLTEDMDFGVMVADWSAFEAVRNALLAGGEFSAESPVAFHKLRHQSGAPLDVVPFGGVERAAVAYPELFTSAIYEHEVTSARLVGLDMRDLLDEQARQQLMALIEPEANLNGSRVLAQQSGVEDGLACRMLAGLCDGLRAS